MGRETDRRIIWEGLVVAARKTFKMLSFTPLLLSSYPPSPNLKMPVFWFSRTARF